MALEDPIIGLSPAARFRVADGEVSAAPGAVDVVSGVSVVPGLSGEALRLERGRVTAKSVANFSADRAMTIVAWIRCLPEVGARRVISRENGTTLVSLQITAGGQPRLELRSTVGNYSISLTGSKRVDDGEWHLVAAVVRKKYNALGLDTRGIDTYLWIDGVQNNQGYFTPGLFGSTPNFGMSTDVILGQAAGGTLAFTGDIQTAAVSATAASDSVLRAMWTERPEVTGGFTGWGIILG